MSDAAESICAAVEEDGGENVLEASVAVLQMLNSKLTQWHFHSSGRRRKGFVRLLPLTCPKLPRHCQSEAGELVEGDLQGVAGLVNVVGVAGVAVTVLALQLPRKGRKRMMREIRMRLRKRGENEEETNGICEEDSLDKEDEQLEAELSEGARTPQRAQSQSLPKEVEQTQS